MVSKQIKLGFEALKENPAEIVFGFVLSGFISMFTFGILLGPMLVGYNHMLRKFKRGESSGMSEMFQVAFSDLTTPLLAISLPTILLGIVLTPLVLVLPSFLRFPFTFVWPAYYILYLAWAGPVFACEDFEEWMDGVKKTWKFGTGSADRIILAIVLMIFSNLGVILCGIGVFLTSSIAAYGLLSAYMDETSEEETSTDIDEKEEKEEEDDEDKDEKKETDSEEKSGNGKEEKEEDTEETEEETEGTSEEVPEADIGDTDEKKTDEESGDVESSGDESEDQGEETEEEEKEEDSEEGKQNP